VLPELHLSLLVPSLNLHRCLILRYIQLRPSDSVVLAHPTLAAGAWSAL